jgi:cytochrome c553
LALPAHQFFLAAATANNNPTNQGAMFAITTIANQIRGGSRMTTASDHNCMKCHGADSTSASNFPYSDLSSGALNKWMKFIVLSM